MLKIDNNLNLILTLHPFSVKEPIEIYLPCINSQQFQGIENMLGATYTLIKQDINPDVFVVDWSIKLKEALKDNYIQELNKFEAFYQRLLLTAELYNANDNIFYKMVTDKDKLVELGIFDDVVENDFKGLLLFILALWRYIRGTTRESVLGLFVTSLTLSEWKDSHKKSTQELNSQDTQSLKVEVI